MLTFRNLRIVLALIVLALGSNLKVEAQMDCSVGIRIHAHDEKGQAVKNAKLEVSGLTRKDVLPSNFRWHEEKDGVYVGIAYEITQVKGDFILRASAAGFETFERQFKFPVCSIDSYGLGLRPEGAAPGSDELERLFTVHGRVYDQRMKPFGNARIEATSAGGRKYQTFSNAYGYYEIDLPKGSATIRVTGSRIPDIVFSAYRVEENYSVLNVPVCLECKSNESKN